LKLILNRFVHGITCTIGDLLVDGEQVSHTLEDLPRQTKIPGETRIPAGTYSVLLTVSPAVAAGRLWSPLPTTELPLLINVPGFDGVRIHAGNTDKQTQGCILVGDWSGGEFIKNSRARLEQLCDLMAAAKMMRQSVTIEINDPETE
jgi:hypothetical protein